jgi:cytochrome c1
MKKIIKLISVFALSILLFACGKSEKQNEAATETVVKNTTTEQVVEEMVDPKTDKGVGPIKSVTLSEIDDALVEKGKEVFKNNCTACHKIDKRFVGPAIQGITERRTPEWIMNMILNPEVMVEQNEEAKKLLQEYNAPMANQNLTEEEARAILEYFRTKI